MAGRWALFERWLASVKRIVAQLTNRANLLGVARSFSFFCCFLYKSTCAIIERGGDGGKERRLSKLFFEKSRFISCDRSMEWKIEVAGG